MRDEHLEVDLQNAIENSELFLCFQPQYQLKSLHLVGLEALVRWRHPMKGLISPSDFIPLAERTGLIVPLGEWVLRNVCQQVVIWRNQGFFVPPVSVNLSPVQFQRTDLVSTITDVLQETGIRGSLLRLEVTESNVIEDMEPIIHALHALRAQGIQIAIDDFGSGYASLSYLSKLPVDVLKIDRSFISDVHKNERNRIIVQSIVQMSQALGICVTAEGIELAEQCSYLQDIQCDMGQGFYFSLPLPPVEVESVFRDAPTPAFMRS